MVATRLLPNYYLVTGPYRTVTVQLLGWLAGGVVPPPLRGIAVGGSLGTHGAPTWGFGLGVHEAF